ncbi:MULTISPECIES: hypothetical protein [Thermocrispum]|uniref:Uncharacterized protein n=1 Tax=Thermocrispum agreste TaxID=37925 RepID=A0A2W4JCS9_9PSEU|nr:MULTISPECIES: hypothetical protein [Thermocrispum]PZM97082.1 MAG: hypothetical protein DIU77_09800 [Thermocrispum agreste]
MTSSAEEPEYSTQLRQLVARGFRFVHPTDASGQLAAVVGVRVHDGVIDVVRLEAEDDVSAMRIPADEDDVMAPRRVLWQSSGAVTRVLADVLELPDDPGDQDDDQGNVVRGCWVPVDHRTSKWVPASA